MSVVRGCLAAADEHAISLWCQHYNRISFNLISTGSPLNWKIAASHAFRRDKNRNTLATGVVLWWKFVQLGFHRDTVQYGFPSKHDDAD